MAPNRPDLHARRRVRTADLTVLGCERAPDVVHVASALAARGALGEESLLTLDERVREDGRAVGFEVSP